MGFRGISAFPCRRDGHVAPKFRRRISRVYADYASGRAILAPASFRGHPECPPRGDGYGDGAVGTLYPPNIRTLRARGLFSDSVGSRRFPVRVSGAATQSSNSAPPGNNRKLGGGYPILASVIFRGHPLSAGVSMQGIGCGSQKF